MNPLEEDDDMEMDDDAVMAQLDEAERTGEDFEASAAPFPEVPGTEPAPADMPMDDAQSPDAMLASLSPEQLEGLAALLGTPDPAATAVAPDDGNPLMG